MINSKSAAKAASKIGSKSSVGSDVPENEATGIGGEADDPPTESTAQNDIDRLKADAAALDDGLQALGDDISAAQDAFKEATQAYMNGTKSLWTAQQEFRTAWTAWRAENGATDESAPKDKARELLKKTAVTLQDRNNILKAWLGYPAHGHRQ